MDVNPQPDLCKTDRATTVSFRLPREHIVKKPTNIDILASLIGLGKGIATYRRMCCQMTLGRLQIVLFPKGVVNALFMDIARFNRRSAAEEPPLAGRNLKDPVMAVQCWPGDMEIPESNPRVRPGALQPSGLVPPAPRPDQHVNLIEVRHQPHGWKPQIGRASCRERVFSSV